MLLILLLSSVNLSPFISASDFPVLILNQRAYSDWQTWDWELVVRK